MEPTSMPTRIPTKKTMKPPEELQRRKEEIFERYESKYLMKRETYRQIMKEIRNYMELDSYGHSLICNLYYDTPDYSLIRRSLDHPLYKEKLRMRSYGVARPGEPVFIELKKKYDGIVYKRRIRGREDWLGPFAREKDEGQIAREIRYTYNRYRNLKPRVYLSYEREAYYLKEGDPNFRVTFDERMLYRTTDLSLQVPPYGQPIVPEDQVLMEVKCTGSIPFWLARALSQAKVYESSFSKYGTAYRQMQTRKDCRDHQAYKVKNGNDVNTNKEYGGNKDAVIF